MEREIWNKLYNEAKKVLNPRQVSNNVEAGGVSAAILTKDGNIYKGVCIDTACSLGMCAERNAISTMITLGENEITHLICIGQNNEIMMPCGACRELLLQICENNKKTKIITNLESYEYVELEDLMPKWWN